GQRGDGGILPGAVPGALDDRGLGPAQGRRVRGRRGDGDRLKAGHSRRGERGTCSEPASRSRYRAARTSSISVIGVVTVRNPPIRISCSTGRPCSTEKQVIDAATIRNVPRVVPSVGACTRW